MRDLVHMNEATSASEEIAKKVTAVMWLKNDWDQFKSVLFP